MDTASLTEQITESFYAWELRGRGWQTADYRVVLEPPFRYCQLLPRYAQSQTTPIDDGRRPTFGSTLVERARAFLNPPSHTPAPIAPQPFDEPSPYPAETDSQDRKSVV